MKIIRKQAFETNSSSSHSLVIDPSVKTYSSITPDSDGNIVLTGGQFGWEWDKHTDPYTKANYLAVSCMGHCDREDKIKEVIKEHTGAKDVIFDIGFGYESYNYSYIDHQSLGAADFIFEKDLIKEFLFGGGILYTGNDNDSPPANFYDLNKKYDFEIWIEEFGRRNSVKVAKEDLEMLPGYERNYSESQKSIDYVYRFISDFIYDKYSCSSIFEIIEKDKDLFVKVELRKYNKTNVEKVGEEILKISVESI